MRTAVKNLLTRRSRRSRWPTGRARRLGGVTATSAVVHRRLERPSEGRTRHGPVSGTPPDYGRPTSSTQYPRQAQPPAQVNQSINQSINQNRLLSTHADGRRVGMVFNGVCVFVCLVCFPHDISKTDAARVIHHESWKPIYFGVKRSKVKVTSHQKHCRHGYLHSCEC